MTTSSKLRLLCYFLFCSLTSAAQEIIKFDDNTITIKLKSIKGVGPLGNSYSSPHSIDENFDGEATKFYPILNDVPPSLTNVRQFYFPLSQFQFYYQNYTSGLFKRSLLVEKAGFYGWNLADTINLSSKPIKCGVAFITAIDKNKNDVYLVDENNNGTLNDDTARALTRDNRTEAIILKSSVPVKVQYYGSKQLIERSILVNITRAFNPEKPEVGLSFPEFGYAKFSYQGKDYVVCSSGFFLRPFMCLMPDRPNFLPVTYTDQITPNHFFKIGDADFKLMDLNNFTDQITISGVGVNEIVLDGAATARSSQQSVSKARGNRIISASRGFYAPKLSGKNINAANNKAINVSTDQLKGKYVYLDFWGTYCIPCIQDMPNLANIYKRYGGNKFEIIGILDEPSFDISKKLFKKYHISWPNVKMRSPSTNYKGYAPVTSFPTSYLIDPDGKIIAVNLKSNELLDTLKSLIK